MFWKNLNIGKKYKELYHLAYHDALTGFYNRHYLYKNLDKLSKYRYVYFIDINNLHKINKKGHTFGDMFIKQVAEQLLSITKDFRKEIIRYSGDEFLIFANYNNLIKNHDNYSVGCSATILHDSVIDSINEADARMMHFKEQYHNIHNY